MIWSVRFSRTKSLLALLSVCLASTAAAQARDSDGDHVKPIAIAGVIGAVVGTGLGYAYVAIHCETGVACDGTRAELTGALAGAAVGVIIEFFIQYGERPGQRVRNVIKLPDRKPLQRTALPGASRIPYLDVSWMNRAAR